MKRMARGVFSVVAAMLCTACGTAVAEGLAIQSFDGAGKLSFSRVPTATVYRVEWAPTPAGPWTNTWAGLDAIAQFATGSYTCSVPMCYRVVALVTNMLPVTPSGMVAIPAGSNSGTNLLGVGESYDTGHYPQTYSLTVAAFFMDATEVTKAQWDTVYTWAVTNGYGFDSAGSGKAADHPVQTVNWYDCVKWCNARSEMEGRTPAYYTTSAKSTVYKTGQIDIENDCVNWGSGYRLPTDVEWEYAARGGLSDKRFPWGGHHRPHAGELFRRSVRLYVRPRLCGMRSAVFHRWKSFDKSGGCVRCERVWALRHGGERMGVVSGLVSWI